MGAGASSSKRPLFLPALTGIRAFAALLVLILHANQRVPSAISENVEFLHRGYLGVDLFFILSGYVIAHVYLEAMARPSARAVRVFLWHRFIRLFPAHAAVLIGLIALVLIGRAAGVPFRADEGWSLADLPWHFLMIHAWGTVETAGWNSPSWSISAEWAAYLLFPLIALALARLRRHSALLVAFVALAAMMLAFELADWRIKTAWLGEPAIIRVVGEFICGACLRRAAVFSGFGAAAPARSDVAGLIGLAGYVVAAQLEAHDFVLISLLALAVLGVSGGGGVMNRLFAARPAVWLGETSYSLYIVHMPVLFVFRAGLDEIGFEGWTGAARVIAFLAAIAIAIVAASLLFYTIERPIRRHLRDRLGPIEPT